MPPVDPDMFLSKLDSNDRLKFIRSWMRFQLKSELPITTTAFVEGAFAAWDVWSAIPNVAYCPDTCSGAIGAARVIQKRLEERPNEAEMLANRTIPYFTSPNINVAAHAMAPFRQLPQYFALVEPAIRDVSMSDYPHPIFPPGSGKHTLRSIAFAHLFHFNPRYAADGRFRTAMEERYRALIEAASMSESPTDTWQYEQAQQLIDARTVYGNSSANA